jgi:hypothetical protein
MPITSSLSNTCGECDPATNSILDVDVKIKFPFSSFGVTIPWPTFHRKQNKGDCNLKYSNNDDSTKFASAASFTQIINGVYWCNPNGGCEVQNELIPGWMKYWLKRAMGAFSVYQWGHGLLQLIDKGQGSEVLAVGAGTAGVKAEVTTNSIEIKPNTAPNTGGDEIPDIRTN